MKNKSSNLNKTIDWNKWWNSFEKADLKRVQGKQKREDIFGPTKKSKKDLYEKFFSFKN